jgi:hypothetical protein
MATSLATAHATALAAAVNFALKAPADSYNVKQLADSCDNLNAAAKGESEKEFYFAICDLRFLLNEMSGPVFGWESEEKEYAKTALEAARELMPVATVAPAAAPAKCLQKGDVIDFTGPYVGGNGAITTFWVATVEHVDERKAHLSNGVTVGRNIKGGKVKHWGKCEDTYGVNTGAVEKPRVVPATAPVGEPEGTTEEQAVAILKGYDCGPHTYAPAAVSEEQAKEIEATFQVSGLDATPCAVCGLPCEMCEGTMRVAGEEPVAAVPPTPEQVREELGYTLCAYSTSMTLPGAICYNVYKNSGMGAWLGVACPRKDGYVFGVKIPGPDATVYATPELAALEYLRAERRGANSIPRGIPVYLSEEEVVIEDVPNEVGGYSVAIVRLGGVPIGGVEGGAKCGGYWFDAPQHSPGKCRATREEAAADLVAAHLAAEEEFQYSVAYYGRATDAPEPPRGFHSNVPMYLLHVTQWDLLTDKNGYGLRERINSCNLEDAYTRGSVTEKP